MYRLPIEVTGRLSVVHELDVEKTIEAEYDQWVRQCPNEPNEQTLLLLDLLCGISQLARANLTIIANFTDGRETQRARAARPTSIVVLSVLDSVPGAEGTRSQWLPVGLHAELCLSRSLRACAYIEVRSFSEVFLLLRIQRATDAA